MDGLGDAAGAAPVRLILLRHGESTWNQARRVQGHNDESVLTERGRDEVRRVVESLEGTVGAIVSSDLARAAESARVAAQVLGLDVRFDRDLRERNFGELEGAPIATVSAASVGVAEGVIVDEHARPAGGESLREVADRTWRALSRAAASGDATLVVTHGGPIRLVLASPSRGSLDGAPWCEVDNASPWPVDVEPGSG